MCIRDRPALDPCTPHRGVRPPLGSNGPRTRSHRRTYGLLTFHGKWACGIGAVVTGLVAMVRHHERSWMVVLATVFGLLPLALLISEIALGKFWPRTRAPRGGDS